VAGEDRKGHLHGPMADLASPAPAFIVRGDPAYRRTNLALFLSGFSTFSLLYCVQPLLPVLARAFEVTAAQSSLALSLTTGLLAVAIALAGIISASLGRKPLMVASLCLAAVLNLLAAAAPSWPLLLVARALEGVALGGAPAIAMTYLAEEVHPEGLGFAMGLYVGGTALGGMAGRVLTGIAADLGGWRVALGAIGLLGLASAVGFALLLPASRHFVRRTGLGPRHHASAFTRHLRAPALPWLFATGFLVMGSFVTLYNYAGFRLTAPPYRLSQTDAGLIFTVYLVGMLGSSLAGSLADRFGRWPVLTGGLILFALGLGATLLQPLAAVIAGVALVTAGFFVAHAVASGWVGALADGEKGHAASLYLLAYYAGSSVMGSLGGVFWAAARWDGVAAFVGVLLLAAFAVAARLSVVSGPGLTGPGRSAGSGPR
jgi:MFS transporter, YNFM family, putative membrane transport protein